MAHLLRAITDAKLKRGYVTVGNDLRAIDQNTFVAVNGDAGGTWTPSNTLAINGAGVVFAAPCAVSGAQMTVYAPTFNKGTYDDVFGLATSHPGRTQTLVQGLVECYSSQPEWVVFYPGPNNFIQGLATTTPGVRFLSPIRVFHGALLETVTLQFVVTAIHASLPTTLAQMRVVAIDANGVVLPMGAGGLYDAGGFRAVSAATTGSAWYNGGATQSFVYTCSQNNAIDIGKYTYWLEIIDESGANTFAANSNAGNIYVSATSYLAAITLFDGRN
jgi:hypothetical protein